MSEIPQFNTEKHILGKLCKHGHEFHDTGMSLRYKKQGRCVQCIKNWVHSYRVNNTEKVKQYSKNHYLNNLEKVKQKNKNYYLNNPKKVKQTNDKFRLNNPEYLKNYRLANLDKIKKNARKKSKEQIVCLDETYICQILYTQGYFNSMVEAKKHPEIIEMYRLKILNERLEKIMFNGIQKGE